MSWAEWKQFVRWSPLRDFPGTAVPVTETIYSIGPSAFIVAQAHNAELIEDGHGPYVTILAWAASLGALRRVLDLEIEQDEGVRAIPPHEMLPGSDARYSSILKHARLGPPGNWLEHASYRIASDGKFVQRSITFGTFAFHFRETHGDGDQPFCIYWRGLGSAT